MTAPGEDAPYTAETLLDEARSELQLRVEGLDALDAKCGVLLGFSGAVAALTPDTDVFALRVIAVSLAVIAAVLAAIGTWPIKLRYPGAAATRHRYLNRPTTEHSTIHLVDQYIVLAQEVEKVAKRKARAARWATIALVLAVVFGAVGVVSKDGKDSGNGRSGAGVSGGFSGGGTAAGGRTAAGEGPDADPAGRAAG